MDEEAVDEKEHDPGEANTELKNIQETPTDQLPAEGKSPTAVDNNDDTESPADNNDDAESPADNNDDAESPADNNDDAESPADNNDDAESPADNNDDAESPADNNDDTEYPADNNDDAESPADKLVTHEGGSAGQENAEEVDKVTRGEPGDAPAETEGRSAATPQPAGGGGDEAAAGIEPPAGETFDVGESPEMTLLIGELLSREVSAMLENEHADDDDDEDRPPPPLDPGTAERERRSPEKRGAEEDKEDEGPSPTGDAGPGVDYEEYMGHFRRLQEEKERLSQLNGQLQVKLVEYFRKKTGEDTRSEKQKAVSDQEQRYQTYMAIMEDLKRQHQRDSEAAQLQAEELRLETQEKLGQVEREWGGFMALKRDVAVSALSRRRGKQAAQAEVEEIQAGERRREGELARARLENVKLKNATARLEGALRAREELAEGLHLIDFEQLKIENQTYGEKIEERNEELLKLRKKITSTVQVLTHVKDKLQFVQMENQTKRTQLAEAEAAVARKRDVLTRTKQARDGLRTDNLRLRQRCGLLGNAALLRDLEEKADAADGLEERLEGLRRRHAGLVLKCAGVKRKLEQSRPEAQ